MKVLRSVLLLSLLPWSSTWAQDEQVVVMTSYPQELINRYESAFEAAHPDIDLVLEWRHSDDARALLEQGGAIDVYWAPTLDTFVILADAGYFTPLPLPLDGLPGRVGGLAIDDAQARFAAFEVAGLGVAYSEAWMAEHGVTLPADWKDLPASPLADSLLLPVPGRVFPP
ncbi:MAG TPA: extracellular solute-binding protein [Hyphomicrobiales bacterium]|nr:extracellular solute-binding protein [Hyphomicrobiales bacterium]